MTQQGDYLRRLRDNLHEVMVLLDRLIAEQDRIEDAALNRRTLRSVADLRDDDEQARAEHYQMRGGA